MTDLQTMATPVAYANLVHLVPDIPLLISGTFGGPFVVFILTPLRNALTLASQDRVSSTVGIYRQCFRGGFLRGWTGGVYPSIPAIPQFVTLGPLYHMFSGLMGPYLALFPTAMTETAFTMGAQCRNAQMAFNESITATSGRTRIANLSSSFSLVQPGLGAHIGRNVVGMTGIRVFAAPINRELDTLFPSASMKSKRTASDFLGSLCSGILSTPFHQTFNFLATSPQAREMNALQRFRLSVQFLKGQYWGPRGPSKTMLRDIALRSVYSMGLFGIYGTIERNMLDYWYM